MSENKFIIGDVVKLKSGSPKMTVSQILDEADVGDVAECSTVWFADNVIHRDVFFFDELEFAAEE